MTSEEMKELKGLAASMGLYDDKNPCKRAVILGKAIKALEQEPCPNAISRSDMLDAIGHGTTYTSEDLQRIIKGLPSVNPQPCEDAISRQAVDDYIVKLLSGYLYDEERTRLEELSAYMWELPSVKPQEPKTGHWISSHIPESILDECSECGFSCGAFTFNYCPNCGAKMESEDKEDAE